MPLGKAVGPLASVEVAVRKEALNVIGLLRWWGVILVVVAAADRGRGAIRIIDEGNGHQRRPD